MAKISQRLEFGTRLLQTIHLALRRIALGPWYILSHHSWIHSSRALHQGPGLRYTVHVNRKQHWFSLPMIAIYKEAASGILLYGWLLYGWLLDK